jgi:putative membrane-bound dehydrogenase-like protein
MTRPIDFGIPAIMMVTRCSRWFRLLVSLASLGSRAAQAGRFAPPRLRVPVALPWLLVIITVGVLSSSLLTAQTSAPYAAQEAPAPLPAEEAIRTLRLPEGFRAEVFAAEPDVRQPIGFCMDDRGRLWVAEAYNYPHHGTKPGDRILIFADHDGDGRFDERKVFCEQLNYVTGIEVGFGGVWVMSPPYFYFIPDRDGDDRPDGAPQTLLDGFGNHANSHNLANALAWGPDGWLYGTHGRTNWSMIGKPGTADAERKRFDGGVYRYHPTRHVWEAFADGTTNPWGIDWDDYGEAFVSNCVNPHLFHIIQGAHYEPWRKRTSSEHAYERIDTIADHLHYVGDKNVWKGLGTPEEDAIGGGHAHCGTMVYLGDNWPDHYRNTVFMNNVHGRRINNDTLRRVGSGYVASHAPDVVVWRDPWFMGVTLQYGPDGGVFVSDWSDTGECHSVTNTQRQTGRIYKITFGQPKPARTDLVHASPDELVALQKHTNDWYVRHARRLLQERAASGYTMEAARGQLRAMLQQETSTPRRLRALWALHAIGAADTSFLLALLQDRDESIQAWAVRLLTDRLPIDDPITDRLQALATSTRSPRVRLALASALQRLDSHDRWDLAAALADHGEDAQDANLPLMIWYGLEPLATVDASRFAALLSNARIPTVQRLGMRRLMSVPPLDTSLSLATSRLVECPDASTARSMLAGLIAGLAGHRELPMPANWTAARARLLAWNDAEITDLAVRLGLIFHDAESQQRLRDLAVDPSQPDAARRSALDALIAHRADNLESVLLRQLDDLATRDVAVRGLAACSPPGIAAALLKRYANFPPELRQEALQTLAARSDSGSQLLDAIDAGQVPLSDLTALTIRSLRMLRDPQVAARVQERWGATREASQETKQAIDDIRQQLTTDALREANLPLGRSLFQLHCGNCHRLFDAGGQIGPNLTGSQRHHLDYLLENILDPHASVARDYQLHLVEMVDGRIVSGLILEDTERIVTMQTAGERITIARSDIERLESSRQSLMPQGLLRGWTPEQIRDLFGYLMSDQQVPLPAP